MNTKKHRNIFAFNVAEEANKKDVAAKQAPKSWEANKEVLAGHCTETLWWGITSYSDGAVYC